MQNSKQKQIVFSISNISDEAMRVLSLAKLDKILPIEAVSGPAQLVDIDVFSKTGEADSALASQVAKPAEPEDFSAATSDDDDLIAALASGEMAGDDVANSELTVDANDGGQTVEETPISSPSRQKSRIHRTQPRQWSSHQLKRGDAEKQVEASSTVTPAPHKNTEGNGGGLYAWHFRLILCRKPINSSILFTA